MYEETNEIENYGENDVIPAEPMATEEKSSKNGLVIAGAALAGAALTFGVTKLVKAMKRKRAEKKVFAVYKAAQEAAAASAEPEAVQAEVVNDNAEK